MDDQIQQLLDNPLFRKVSIITIGVIAIWLIIRIIQRTIFSKITDNHSHYTAKKLSNFVGTVLTVILLAVVFSEKLYGLTVAFGLAGAGIAFALQEVIVSFAGWVTIMFGGFYKPGDRVQLGGIKGDVMDIGMIRTTIMETGQWVDGDLYNGRMVYIANSFVFKEPVFNYSGDFPFLWDEIKIPIQFGSDYDMAKTMFEQLGKDVAGDLSIRSKEKWKALQLKYRLEDAQTEAMISMIANDNWVEFTLRYIVNYKKRRATKTELFSRILKSVEATNGKIRFASATFHLVEAPEFKVKISDDAHKTS